MEVTILSYPDTHVDNLLSLTQGRSKYMIPFAGKFRVVDFLINSALNANAHVIIYSNLNDDLPNYIDQYGIDASMLKVVIDNFNSMDFCYSLIRDTDSAYFIIYNGDNPGIINFDHLLERFVKTKKQAILYKMHFGQKARMAHRILVTTKKTLLAAIRTAMKQQHQSPNIFEMIINMMINDGIIKNEFSCLYWPFTTIVDYYTYNFEAINNPDYNKHIFGGQLYSKIQLYRYSMLGPCAKVANSFLSDSCYINAEVYNSIIFPGVEIGEGTVVRDSILLPYTKIGAKVQIRKAIIDERMVHPFEPEPLNIDNGCKIGTGEEQLKNADYPKVLYNGITLIGKDCQLPSGITVGSACYMHSGCNEAFFAKKRYIYNGTTV